MNRRKSGAPRRPKQSANGQQPGIPHRPKRSTKKQRSGAPRLDFETWDPDRIGALCALGCLQFFVCEQIARLGWPGHYSMSARHISDLGEPSLCAAHAVMNGSFLAQGLLIAGAALLLPRTLALGRLGRLARAALLLAAIGVAIVGLFPADRDPNMHVAGARLHFAASSAGLLLWGCAQLFRSTNQGAHNERWGAWAALGAAIVAIAGDVLLLHPAFSPLGAGVAERMAAYPLPLWLAYTGFTALRRESANPLDL